MHFFIMALTVLFLVRVVLNVSALVFNSSPTPLEPQYGDFELALGLIGYVLLLIVGVYHCIDQERIRVEAVRTKAALERAAIERAMIETATIETNALERAALLRADLSLRDQAAQAVTASGFTAQSPVELVDAVAAKLGAEPMAAERDEKAPGGLTPPRARSWLSVARRRQ